MRLPHRLTGPENTRGGGARAALAFVVAALLLAAAPLAAQTGRITGRVLSAQGEPVPSAQVNVQGTQLRVSTDIQGRYTLSGVPAGTHAVVASALSYASKTVTGVVVAAGQPTELNISLSGTSLILGEVVVTAQAERGSVTQALDEQRTAVGVVNAVGAEQIARSPDSDAAQAIRRVSGVTVQDGRYVVVRGLSERYTTASLNGARLPSPEPERRVVPLDLFPAGLLQAVTTAKTFTPDLPGDFSGALVNIRTREYPTRPIFTVSGSLGGSSTVLGKDVLLPPSGSVQWTGVAGSEYDLPAAAAQVGGTGGGLSPEQRNQIVNSFRNVWTPEMRTGEPNGSLSATLGGTTPVLGRDLGYVGSFSYSRDVEARGDYERAQVLLTDAATQSVTSVDRFEGSVASVGVLWGGVLNFSTSLGGDNSVSFNNTFNRSTDTEAREERGSLESIDPGLPLLAQRLRTVERTVRSNQLRGEHRLAGRHGIDWSVTSSGVTRAEPDRAEFLSTLQDGVREWFSGVNDGAVRTFGDLDENTLEGALNYRLSLGGGGRHRLSVGGMARNTDRDATNRSFSISALGLPADALRLAPEEIFDGRFTRPGDAYFQVVPLVLGGSYAAEDRLVSGYGMLEYSLTDRVRVIGGARVENSRVEVRSLSSSGDPSLADPEYTDVLPALSVNVDVTGQQKLRFAVSQTLARPEYRELSDVIYNDVIGGDLLRGNPDLRRSLIQNFDARWEWYPASDEIVSVGVFAKRFDDPIERVYIQTSGNRVVTFTNAEQATNYGVELELRKSLAFAGTFGESFSVTTNATFVHSDVEVVNEDADRPMVGQSPYVVNAGLAYSPASGRTTATVLYNVFGRRITSAGLGNFPDVYEQPRGVLDLSLRQDLSDRMSLKVDAENLLDAAYEYRQGGVTRERYRSGRSISFGVTWRG